MNWLRGYGGAVYVAVNIAATALLFWWLLRPMFFEQPEPQRSREQVRYELRLMAGVAGDDRKRLAAHCIEGAANVALRSRDPQLLFDALEGVRALAPDAVPREYRCIEPGACWFVRVGDAAAPSSAYVLLHNGTATAATLALEWHGGSEAALLQNGADSPLQWHDGRAESRHDVAAGDCTALLVECKQLGTLQLAACRRQSP